MRTDFNTNSGANFRSSWYDRFFKSLPTKDLSNPVKYNKIGSMLTSPHWNRTALGAAAISTQPFIDYFNPNVDRETAKVSTVRTTSKIIVCTSIGFIVRGLSFKLAEKYMHGTPEEGSVLLTPESILKETNKKIRDAKLKLHKNSFSTITALTVMLLVTNSLLDAPLTTLVSNLALSKLGLDKNKKEEKIYA